MSIFDRMHTMFEKLNPVAVLFINGINPKIVGARNEYAVEYEKQKSILIKDVSDSIYF